jgi:hypothetical protein
MTKGHGNRKVSNDCVTSYAKEPGHTIKLSNEGIFNSAGQWRGKGEKRILCPNITFDNSLPSKMTKRKMQAG